MMVFYLILRRKRTMNVNVCKIQIETFCNFFVICMSLALWVMLVGISRLFTCLLRVSVTVLQVCFILFVHVKDSLRFAILMSFLTSFTDSLNSAFLVT